jgi:ABC-2 type transport system permease protein
MIGPQALAIVWAQWRSMMNHYQQSRSNRFPLAAVFALVWYGFWTFLAGAVSVLVSDPKNLDLLHEALPAAMFGIFVYWQIVPIMMVSSGVSLHLPRVLVYPIPHAQLFTIEVLLRVTTCVEMLLVSGGIAVGILRNPQLPVWSVLPLVVFGMFNLFVSAGLKDLLGRSMARKGVREAMVFVLVLIAALPQVLLTANSSPASLRGVEAFVGPGTPWGATARLALGSMQPVPLGMLIVWAVLAWLFGRIQFERTLHFDAAEANGSGRSKSAGEGAGDRFLRLVGRLFPDPMGALVEKEIRFLSRSPRFRLLFLMGFSFGLLIWLPMAARHEPDSFFQSNFLTVVCAYALMLIGEVCFWNSFGLDRGAVQAYFAMPLSMSTVLRAKNVAAMFFVFLELTLVSLFCTLLRMPVTLASVTEAFAVTLVFAIFLLSLGNLLSVRYPRPVDPTQSWRTGSVGRAQAYLLFLYPAAAAPVALAYGARYAFDQAYAFYAVLMIDLLIAVAVYTISLESAAATADQTKESMVLALSKAEGPMGG